MSEELVKQTRMIRAQLCVITRILSELSEEGPPRGVGLEALLKDADFTHDEIALMLKSSSSSVSRALHA